MDSPLPKVLVPVLDRPMILYVLDAIAAAGIERAVVVVGYEAHAVREALADRKGISFALQSEQLGTGHAVMMCRGTLADHDGAVVVLAGDSPLTQASSLQELLDEFHRSRPACIVGTAYTEQPEGLGRVLRDEGGRFLGIVEEKDATDAERAINEVNMSTYVFDCQPLLAALDQLTTENAQGEYYITDVPGILIECGAVVDAVPALLPCEALSINTVDQLAAVEQAMKDLP